jgi:hypothetical protein
MYGDPAHRAIPVDMASRLINGGAQHRRNLIHHPCCQGENESVRPRVPWGEVRPTRNLAQGAANLRARCRFGVARAAKVSAASQFSENAPGLRDKRRANEISNSASPKDCNALAFERKRSYFALADQSHLQSFALSFALVTLKQRARLALRRATGARRGLGAASALEVSLKEKGRSIASAAFRAREA